MVVMASGSLADRFMIDPSVLLTAEAIQALHEEGLPSGSVVSKSFYDALGSGPDELFLPFMMVPDQQLLRRARDELRSLLEGAEKYSYHSMESLPEEFSRIRGNLLEREGAAGRIFADEFVYLATQSWLTSKVRKIGDALKGAGADVVEYFHSHQEQSLRALIATVVPEAHIPAQLTGAFLTKVGVKWVVFGGSTVAGVFVPPVGLLAIGEQIVYRMFDP